MSDNLPPLPAFEAWLRSVCFQAPPVHAYDLARCAWVESDKQATTDVEVMAEEIQRLQKALAFWMPGVPDANHALHERVAHDAYLLAGYDGPNNEPSAVELGHVSLAAIEANTPAVPDGWREAYAAFKGAFDTPFARFRDDSDFANDARRRLSAFNEAVLAAAQPQPVAQPVQRTHVMVPLRMTKAMRDVTNEEDWSWEDLLAAAEAITEAEYSEVSQHSVTDEPQPVQASVAHRGIEE